MHDHAQVFASKEEIALHVKQELEQNMKEFGYFIHNALVIDIDPDNKVKYAMNEINAAQRLRRAAMEKAEADKILLVKAAEAEAESKFLQGQGIAKQRAAIVDGLKASLQTGNGDDHLSSTKVTELLLITQYFDTLEKMANGKSNTVFMPHSIGNVGDTASQIRQGILEGSAAQKMTNYGAAGA
jgi:regulator of protease activity HflC (stomatin/prohibitin superfamily)